MNTSVPDDPYRLLHEATKLVRLHRQFGIEAYPRSPGLDRLLTTRPETRPVTTPASDRPRPEAMPTARPAPPGAPAPSPAAGKTLAEIEAEALACDRCPRGPGQGRPLFGTGNAKAALLIVGEAPSAEDEAAGTPFSGEAGQLLARMLKAIGLGLDEAYLTFVVKCRGPEATPPAERLAACLPTLRRQIDAVRPQVICAMGQVAAQALLQSSQPLVRLRGRFHDCHGIPLMPTFAPDFLLHNPDMKKAAWIDLQMIQAKLGPGKA